MSGNYQHLSSAGEWDISGTYAANDLGSSCQQQLERFFHRNPRWRSVHRRTPPMNSCLMVSTDGVADIPVQGNLDYTNHFGIAVVPFISNY
ncbi:fimbria/pilus outer membrane usher protein [Shigella flexneri]